MVPLAQLSALEHQQRFRPALPGEIFLKAPKS